MTNGRDTRGEWAEMFAAIVVVSAIIAASAIACAVWRSFLSQEKLPQMDEVHEPPERLSGSELESRLIPRLDAYERDDVATFARPGVHASEREPAGDGKFLCRLLPSLPDFDGIVRNGPYVVFDAKVTSAASFNLAKYVRGSQYSRARQLRHMETRARFDAVCFFLIHWNRRELKTRTDPAETWAFPVDEDLPFWERFHAGDGRNISRDHCRELGVRVPWTTRPRERTARPDILYTVATLVQNNQQRTAETQRRGRPLRVIRRGRNIGEKTGDLVGA